MNDVEEMIASDLKKADAEMERLGFERTRAGNRLHTYSQTKNGVVLQAAVGIDGFGLDAVMRCEAWDEKKGVNVFQPNGGYWVVHGIHVFEIPLWISRYQEEAKRKIKENEEYMRLEAELVGW